MTRTADRREDGSAARVRAFLLTGTHSPHPLRRSMPRRIIYIKNPKEGSNFRTIDADGGGPKPPRPGLPRPPKGKRPSPPKYPLTLTGGGIYKPPPSNWFIHQPGKPNYGNLPNYGVGPYEQTWTSDFVPPTTIWGDLYLIAMGVDPATGNILHGWGTPGTLKPFPQMSFGYGETWKIELYKNLGKSEGFFGKLTPEGFVPTPPSYLAPNRNNKRPWWAK